MNPEIRYAIARALYEASVDPTESRTPQWEMLANKEEWMRKAEKVVEVYNMHIKEDIKRRMNIEREGES